MVSPILTGFSCVRESIDHFHHVIRRYSEFLWAQVLCFIYHSFVTMWIWLNITETGVKIRLQNLLDHKAFRFLKSLLDKVKEYTPRNLAMIIKRGFDSASNQVWYKQTFTSNNSDTAEDCNTFINSLVPVKLFSRESGTLLWQNEKTSSTFFCGPLQFEYIEEHNSTVTYITSYIKSEIESL